MGSSVANGVEAPANERAAYSFARGIISRVSRTFAIGISVLPGDLRKAVLTGYLLCRIADTIEDDGACRELTLGMSQFVGRYPEGIRIQTMDEYRRYCYYVAGTVGHLLTELWYCSSATVRKADYERMLVDCEAFGEALQTINILKDIAWDIEHENAAYIPEDLLRARGSSHQTILNGDWVVQNQEALVALVELAKEDIRKSLEYFNAIPKRALRIRLFCLLPILFAVATLREIERSSAMLQSGGGVKISRSEVRSLIVAGSVSTISNTTTRWLVRKTARTRFKLGLA